MERPRPWHFLQSPLWARHKEAFGWHPEFVPAPESQRDSADLLVLTRRLPAGVFFSYVPYGPATLPGARDHDSPPGVPGPEPSALRRSVDELTPLIRARLADSGLHPALIRFDLPQLLTSDVQDTLTGRRLVPAPVEVQPPATVVVDLDREPDELLAAMHKKNRYNIRLAERKGVRVRRGEPGELSRWYELYRETARRDGITIHSFAYYEQLFELARAYPEPGIHLYLAEHEEEVLAGVIVVHHQGGATYLYGASSDSKRNLMPNYALQWFAMREAKAAGCRWYDLFGIPAADDPSHPMHGLYRFKTGFGGAIVRRLGAWDLPVKPLTAAAFRLAERARDVYFHRMRAYVTR